MPPYGQQRTDYLSLPAAKTGIPVAHTAPIHKCAFGAPCLTDITRTVITFHAVLLEAMATRTAKLLWRVKKVLNGTFLHATHIYVGNTCPVLNVGTAFHNA